MKDKSKNFNLKHPDHDFFLSVDTKILLYGLTMAKKTVFFEPRLKLIFLKLFF